MGEYSTDDFLQKWQAGDFPPVIALEIWYDTEVGGHSLSVLGLIDPEANIVRYFICQSYIFQNALLIEEAKDLESFIRMIGQLPHIRDENTFRVRHDQLFHARAGLMPAPDDWIHYPQVKVYSH